MKISIDIMVRGDCYMEQKVMDLNILDSFTMGKDMELGD